MLKINENYNNYIFLLILFLSFISRSYFWFYGFNQGEPGLFIHGDGYYDRAGCIVDPTCKLNYASFRIIQIAYTLYLTPIFLLNLNDDIYIFFLHHIFSFITIYFIYISGKLIKNKTAGLLGAFLYAIQLQICFWFNFTLSDIAFHMHLSLVMYFFIKFFLFKKNFSFIILISFLLLLSFTRPEGILVLLIALIFVIYHLFSNQFKSKFSIYIYLIFLIGAVNILIFSLVINENLRNTIMSNTHVGWGLYYGSQETKTSAPEVNNMLNEMFNTCGLKSTEDIMQRNEWWWCSKIGFDRIKSDPVNYAKVVLKRIPAVLYPAFYREGISKRYLLISSFFMTYILIGLTFLFFNKFNNTRISMYNIFLVAPIYLLIAFYQDEWDIRYHLSPQIILLLISSIGYLNVLEKIYLNRK